MDSPHDLSLLGLFLRADPVVKATMLLLVALSVLVWATAIDRAVRLRRMLRQARALDAYARGASALNLSPEAAADGLAAAVLAAGRDAATLRHADETRGERRARVADAMRLALADEVAAVQPGLPILATVGSAAPFIGLFGTVWGIMNAFTAIARSGDTSLNTVAPGIAEALSATAIGLAAAIPAVLLYNRLTGRLGRVRGLANGAVVRLADRLAGEGDSAARAPTPVAAHASAPPLPPSSHAAAAAAMPRPRAVGTA